MRGAGPVGDFHVHYDAFEVLLAGVDGGFVADNAVLGFFPLWPHFLLRLLGKVKVKVKSNHRGHRGHRGLRHRGLRVLHARRDYDFLGHFFVEGLDVVVAMSVVEDADHGGMRARERSDNASFGAAIAANGGDFDQDAVSVHGRPDGVRRDEDIAGEAGLEIRIERSGFGNHEAEAVAMHGQAADE